MKTALTNHRFLKHFSVLFSGLVVVQVINFLFSLILPTFFTPEAFAEFGIFTAVVFILIEVINAKLDIAVMLGKDIDEAKLITDAAFSVSILACFLLLLVQVLFLFFLPKIYLLLPFTVLLYGIHQPILVLLNKQEKYASISRFRIIQVLSTCLFTLVLAILHREHALLFGFVTGILCGTLYLLNIYFPSFDWSGTKRIWQQYDQFPKFGTWSSLLNNFSRNSVPVLLNAFFTPALVGFYSYASRLLNAPTGMYATALGQVYFKNASELPADELKTMTRNIIRFTIAISLLPTLLILFFGKDIFYLLFSGEWLEAGKIAQYLILWYFIGVIAAPVSTLLDIKNKLKFEFGFNLLLFVLRIAAICMGGILNDFYLAMLLFAVAGILMNAFLLYYIQYKLLHID